MCSPYDPIPDDGADRAGQASALTSADPNASGNRFIDRLAGTGRMLRVWQQLERRFPRVRRHGQSVWLARRRGDVRSLIERDDRFAAIRRPEGPAAEDEWELLALAALEAAGIGRLTPDQLRTWSD